MKIFEANISDTAIDFFKKSKLLSFESANSKVKSICGINTFFETQSDFDELLNAIIKEKNYTNEPLRVEYGDFQTNKNLSSKICDYLRKQGVSPDVIVEPTCGKGNFIIACLKSFKNIKNIYAVEIYKPYIWETKFAILDFFLNNKRNHIPEINIYHYNVFDFEFKHIAERHGLQKILIIGNPPWVTNSKLSSLGSGNLPVKSNFKKHKGLDAITGKGNFDIGEYISLKLISVFSSLNGDFAFLVKNSVARNILLEQKNVKYSIANIRQFDIDAKKEFNVSVNACLLLCSLNKSPQYFIEEYDFYSKKQILKYGWINNKFVANVELYLKTHNIDGSFPFIWRQGVKHDASKIMELEKHNGHFINNNKEPVIIEKDLVFSLLKSSDLNGNIIESARKYTIITQKKIGEETKYIEEKYPQTYNYLLKNIKYFNKRKSSIYNGKPLFSIFGIGDYSFKPYKVAISGMYKTTKFSLVKTNDSKPIMLDDTCYFIGFDNLIDAEITRVLLNKKVTQDFIKSIAFKDAKRMITKDLLMRIDLNEVVKSANFIELKEKIPDITFNDWKNYKNQLSEKEYQTNRQLNIFINRKLNTARAVS